MSEEVDLKSAIDTIRSKVDTNGYLQVPLSKWKDTLANECQVYVCGQEYLAKRFDQINYEFCGEENAEEILTDNLYALLRFKYFTKTTDETEEKISDIIKSFTSNIKTTLYKVSFNEDSDAKRIREIPNWCVAFRNGVYDFMNNEWLFRYDVISMEKLYNKIYLYDPSYAIMWYLDYNFEPLPFSVMDVDFSGFISLMKEMNEKSRNYCFELIYNMSHDSMDVFSLDRCMHLSEYIGFLLYRGFVEHITFMIGSGGNGKNSLFDGCFTSRCVPRPANNDMDEIENYKFITGSLINHAQNIFLETEAKSYNKSKMIKQLTGSMYQTIEDKNEKKYQSIINCKFMFAGNDQEQIRFGDATNGFMRRINMFEIFYQWDKEKSFMKRGDYYDTTFSDDLHEIKNDVMNTTMFVYFGIYGIMEATKGFERSFSFTYNDWKRKYISIDEDLKSKVESITMDDILRSMNIHKELSSAYFYDDNENKKLFKSTKFQEYYPNGTYKDMVSMFKDKEECDEWFSDNDCYLRIEALYNMIGSIEESKTSFTGKIKKMYQDYSIRMLDNNRPYLRVNFLGRKMKVMK